MPSATGPSSPSSYKHSPDIMPNGPASVDFDIEQHDGHDTVTLTVKITAENQATALGQSVYAIIKDCHAKLDTMIHSGYSCRLCGEADHISLTCPFYDDVITAHGSIDAFLIANPASAEHTDQNDTTVALCDATTAARKRYEPAIRIKTAQRGFAHTFIFDREIYSAHTKHPRSRPCRDGRACNDHDCSFLHRLEPCDVGGKLAYAQLIATGNKLRRTHRKKPQRTLTVWDQIDPQNRDSD